MTEHARGHRQGSATATEDLKNEHLLVEVVIAAMEREADKIDATGEADLDAVARMVDFTQNFTDGCHHAKEERALFPLLRERNAGMQAPTSVMLQQHETGRQRIRGVADALPAARRGAAAAVRVIGENLRAYASATRTTASPQARRSKRSRMTGCARTAAPARSSSRSSSRELHSAYCRPRFAAGRTPLARGPGCAGR